MTLKPSRPSNNRKIEKLPITFLLSFGICIAANLPSISAETYRKKAFSIDNQMLELRGPLTDEDEKAIRKHYIDSIYVMDESNPEIFRAPKKFKHLKDVYLKSKINPSLLDDLDQNYPKLKVMSIIQEAPLRIEDLVNLKIRSDLWHLYLYAPINDPSAAWKCIPNTLSFLSIKHTGLLSQKLPKISFSKMHRMSIFNETIRITDLGTINAPGLKELSIVDSEIPAGFFASLANFPKLESLYLYKNKFSKGDLKVLMKERPTLEISPSKREFE